jgi:hypothetical protein
MNFFMLGLFVALWAGFWRCARLNQKSRTFAIGGGGLFATVIFAIITAVVINAPMWLGITVFIGLGLVLPVVLLFWKSALLTGMSAKIERQSLTQYEGVPPVESTKQISHFEYYRIKNALEIVSAWERGNYDWARRELQKIAYTLVDKSVPQETKDEFTRLMAEFAKEDPLYRQVMARLLPMIHANPGMMQSQIYKGESDEIKEQMRYVIYFSDVLGHIRREKKGNSYRLFPPGNVIDAH